MNKQIVFVVMQSTDPRRAFSKIKTYFSSPRFRIAVVLDDFGRKARLEKNLQSLIAKERNEGVLFPEIITRTLDHIPKIAGVPWMTMLKHETFRSGQELIKNDLPFVVLMDDDPVWTGRTDPKLVRRWVATKDARNKWLVVKGYDELSSNWRRSRLLERDIPEYDSLWSQFNTKFTPDELADAILRLHDEVSRRRKLFGTVERRNIRNPRAEKGGYYYKTQFMSFLLILRNSPNLYDPRITIPADFQFSCRLCNDYGFEEIVCDSEVTVQFKIDAEKYRLTNKQLISKNEKYMAREKLIKESVRQRRENIERLKILYPNIRILRGGRSISPK